ncbi:MAG TPA: hypothetical protein VMD75_04290 [Candidatus Binataceae bacterium]|nr:hypothetical protein [Candidatus Binataceae bacterium]
MWCGMPSGRWGSRIRWISSGLAFLFAIVAIGFAGGTRAAESAADGSSNLSSISFSPAVIKLNNPGSQGVTTKTTTIKVTMTAYDAQGEVITPSAANPLNLALFGAADGLITTPEMTITSAGPVTFTYSGGYFTNPVTLEAWIGNDYGAQSIGVMQFLPKNRPACSYAAQSFTIPTICGGATDPTDCAANNMTGGLQVNAAVGVNSPNASAFIPYTIDTGSLGVIVPVSDLGPDAIGPAGPGKKYYDSSGNIFTGNYYLARVNLLISVNDGTPIYVQTNPIKVLAVNYAYCAPNAADCSYPTPTTNPQIHYLGVGFDRNNTTDGDYFDSPADNAFLEVTDANNGTDITPGYILTSTNVTLGLSSSTGYKFTKLKPNTASPGDWIQMPGCFGFPDINKQSYCGGLLLDVGIDHMYLNLKPARRPKDAVSDSTVPTGTYVNILTGTIKNPSMSYEFQFEPDDATGPAPEEINWVNLVPGVFINTGRRPLIAYNYMFDAQCGQVGFQPN